MRCLRGEVHWRWTHQTTAAQSRIEMLKTPVGRPAPRLIYVPGTHYGILTESELCPARIEPAFSTASLLTKMLCLEWLGVPPWRALI